MSKPPTAETFVASAESDWLVIRNELASKHRAWAMIAYHAHQAAEKYLKVFLMRNGERPLRTHDLDGLLKHCISFDSTLSGATEDCEVLSQFSVAARYEDFTAYDTEPVARRAVEASERVCDAIRARIK